MVFGQGTSWRCRAQGRREPRPRPCQTAWRPPCTPPPGRHSGATPPEHSIGLMKQRCTMDRHSDATPPKHSIGLMKQIRIMYRHSGATPSEHSIGLMKQRRIMDCHSDATPPEHSIWLMKQRRIMVPWIVIQMPHLLNTVSDYHQY